MATKPARSAKSSVAIVVLNWNGASDTIRSVSSLLEQTYENFSIIVVDNGSHDDSLSYLRPLEKDHKNVVLIKNDVNKGFAGGVNTGIDYALKNNFDYIALFNNDARAEKDWLEELVNTINNKTVGITTGLLLHEDGKTIDSTGEFYSTWGLSFPRNRGYKTETAPKGGEVFGATGGASLYAADLFKQIGLFDEDFFAYYEDVDISFRARLAGWSVVYTPRAIAYHKQGATSKKVPGLTIKKGFSNLPQVFVKNVPRGLLWHIGIRFYLSYLLFFVKAIAKGQGWPALQGVVKSIVLTPGSLIKRRYIQKSKKISAEKLRKSLWNDLPPDQAGMRKLRRIFTGKP